MRKRRSAGITVFDEHHEAFLFWNEIFRGENAKRRTLVHVDGHSDMGMPMLTESVYTKDVRGFVTRQLNIGNFIVPGVVRGFFDDVFFLGRGVKQAKRKKSRIGSLYGKGVWIKTGLGKGRLIQKLYPDARDWYFTATSNLAEIPRKPFTLDIDMDYFCGYYLNYSELRLPLGSRQVSLLKRLDRSNDRYKVPLRLFDFEKNSITPRGMRRFKHVIYNNSRPWIEVAIRNFVGSIPVRPDHVSLCRSVKSGYTPAAQASFIEKTLLAYLTGSQKKPIDPRDIPGAFEIYPFIAREGNTLYIPLSHDTVKLNADMLFLWKRIKEGKSFARIIKSMQRAYDLPVEALINNLVRFIFHLKQHFILK